MPAYNFKKQFAEPVALGTKTQTIRMKRVRQTKPGDILKLYTGQRTKECRLLRTVVCKNVQDFRIDSSRDVSVDGRYLNLLEIEELARLDGFLTATQFIDFFENEYGLPFTEAEIIKW